VKSMDEVLEHACIANPLKMATLKNRKRKSSSKRVVQPSL